jgi:hypothetical protein
LHRFASPCIALHRLASPCIASHCIAMHRLASSSIALHRLASPSVALHRLASHRLASPCIALHRLASPCIALHRLASPCIALHRLTSPCIKSTRPNRALYIYIGLYLGGGLQLGQCGHIFTRCSLISIRSYGGLISMHRTTHSLYHTPRQLRCVEIRCRSLEVNSTSPF